MSDIIKTVNVFNGKEITNVEINNNSKKQYAKGDVVELYSKSFTANPGTYYIIPPNCIIKSKNKDRYIVNSSYGRNDKGQVINASITISYKVHKNNILPRYTGDKAVVDFKLSNDRVSKMRIIEFNVDTSYVLSSGETRSIKVIGNPGSQFGIIVKNASGTIIKRFDNLRIPRSKKQTSQGIFRTSIEIPVVSTATTYTVEIIEGANTNLAENIIDTHTINQYAPSGFNVSYSGTTSISLLTTGTTPVAANGLTPGPEGYNESSISWAINKSGPTKIYAHRAPVMSGLIAYNTDGTSDWTNTVTSANNGWHIDSIASIVQTSNTVVTITMTNTVEVAGTANVSPVLNLDNFIKTKPPAFNVTIGPLSPGQAFIIDLASENNTISVDSDFMSGGWSTVEAPGVGSIGSYGAYNGATPGAVTYTAASTEDWINAGRPSQDFFVYKVNDGTTDSDTARVTIRLTE